MLFVFTLFIILYGTNKCDFLMQINNTHKTIFQEIIQI